MGDTLFPLFTHTLFQFQRILTHCQALSYNSCMWAVAATLQILILGHAEAIYSI